ncbi:MAG TPA: LacI family DNA-binding transcriptional regulator [Gaiellaceae bacterium]|nr:LacI family DNA-binding transcriptional regulator [Gaiellaceae bacterium]
MAQIADLAGVSMATVSRVINGRDGVSEEKREAVERVVREHGYRPALGARSLSAGRTGLIAVTVPWIAPSYFTLTIAGVTAALDERELRAVLCPTAERRGSELAALGELLHGTADGAVLILPSASAPSLHDLQEAGHRFVIVDPVERVGRDIAAVSSAHAAGADEAVRHLLELGHRRIAAITGLPVRVATVQRLRGYRAALASAGLLADDELIVESDFMITGGRTAATRLLDLPEPPTAIFAFNDNLAIGAMQVARARGLRLPEELSVVGFDDTGEAELVTPALTTVRQPLAEMGKLAVALLARLLAGEQPDALQLELATELVIRESTAPAP